MSITNEELESYMVRIGDVVYLEMGSVEGSFIHCDGFMNSKVVVENYNLPEKQSQFLKCLFLVLPGDHHIHKASVTKLIKKVF